LKRRRKQQRPPRSKFRYGFELARSEKSGRAFLFLGLTRPGTDEVPSEQPYTSLDILTYT
jgi:hypothetical protein